MFCEASLAAELARYIARARDVLSPITMLLLQLGKELRFPLLSILSISKRSSVCRFFNFLIISFPSRRRDGGVGGGLIGYPTGGVNFVTGK